MKVDVVVVLPAFGNEVTIEEELLFSFFCLLEIVSKPIRWDTPWRTRKMPPWSPYFLDLSQWPLSSMIMIMKQFFNVSRLCDFFQQLGDWRHFQPILHTKRRSGIFK